MKKSLIALAALAAVGAASAQSSVTLYGVIDTNYGWARTTVKNLNKVMLLLIWLGRLHVWCSRSFFLKS